MLRRKLIITLTLIGLVFFLYLSLLYKTPSIETTVLPMPGEIKIFLNNPENRKLTDFLLNSYKKFNNKVSWQYVDSLNLANLYLSEDLNNNYQKIAEKNLNYKLYQKLSGFESNPNGILKTVPILSRQLVVITNLDLAKQYGLSGPPNTWDGVSKACAKINSENLSALQNYCINLGGKSPDDANILTELSLQNIGNFREINDNLSKLKQSLLYFRSFTDTGSDHLGYAIDQNARELFQNQKLVYLIADQDMAYEIKKEGKLNTIVSPLPQIANNTALASFQPLSFSLLSDSKDTNLIIDFIRFSLTEEIQNDLYQDFHYLPINGIVRKQYLLPLPMVLNNSIVKIQKIFAESISNDNIDQATNDLNIKIQALSLP